MSDLERYEHLKPYIWSAAVGFAVFLEFYVHLYLGISEVYTQFFYVLIAMAGMWYRKGVIYIAVFLAIIHIINGFLVTGGWDAASIMRGMMFIIVAAVVAKLSDMATEEHLALLAYITEAALRLRNPVNAIKDNLSEICIDVDDDDVRDQIQVQITHAEQIIENINELNKSILDKNREIPENYREYLSR